MPIYEATTITRKRKTGKSLGLFFGPDMKTAAEDALFSTGLTEVRLFKTRKKHSQ